MDKYDKKGHLQLRPEKLHWTPFLVTRGVQPPDMANIEVQALHDEMVTTKRDLHSSRVLDQDTHEGMSLVNGNNGKEIDREEEGEEDAEGEGDGDFEIDGKANRDGDGNNIVEIDDGAPVV